MKKYEKEVQQAYLDSEKRTLKRLEEVYEDSLGEINERIEMLLARDDANLQNVIYQVDYQRALKKQVEAILDNLQNNEFETVSEYLTESYEDGFIGNLYSMQQQGVPFAFPMDQELIVDAIQHETMLTSSLYTELGLDIKRLQKNIAGEISRGIASSMTYAEIARNVSNYSKIPLNRAMLISRTESHRIRETAVAHSQEKAVAKGADLVRVWDSVMDGKTRSKHLHLDGQKRRVNEPFEAGGKKVMRPGQFGNPADDCNCRCMARCVASWALDADETKRLGNVSKMDDERKKEIADKLKIPVDELENYSKEIIPINAKDFDDFKKQYKKIWNPDNSRSVSGSVQKISERRKTNEGVFDTLNNTDGDTIRPHNVMKEMNKSEVGASALSYLEAEGVPVHLAYGVDNPEHYSGICDPFDDSITIYCDETKTVKETAKATIHEANHRMLGNTGTFEEEVACYEAEILHEKGELTENDTKSIIKFVEKYYPELPRKGKDD